MFLEVFHLNLDFNVVLTNLFGLFLLIGVGWLTVRTGILKPEASAPFSALLLKVTLPCTIFVSLALREYDPTVLRDCLIVTAIGLIYFPFMLFASDRLSILLKIPEGRRGVWSYCAAFCNTGFMGFPVVLNLFGPEGLALAVMINMTLNVYTYSYGAMEISKDSGEKAQPLDMRSVLFSNINLALVLSLIFYFCRLKVPNLLIIPLQHLSGITTPLSMIVAGMALGKSSGRSLFTDCDVYSSSFIRLLVWPILILFVLRLLPIQNPLITPVATLLFAMPAPGVTAMLTEMYHGNTELGAKLLFMQNLLCMLTIPLICMLL